VKVQSQTLATLLAYVQADGRICPQPQRWNELWEMPANRKQKPSGGWNPPLPLILAAWSHKAGLEKMLRLSEQIEYTARQMVNLILLTLFSTRSRTVFVVGLDGYRA